MYVCLCNGVSDKKIRQAVRQFQPQSFQQLRKFVPVGNQCGKCVRAAREIMQDELMGFSTEKIAKPYQYLVVVLNVVILLIALVLVNYFRGQYTASFNTSIHIDDGNLAWNYILWGVYIVVALSAINIGWIYMKVKEIRK